MHCPGCHNKSAQKKGGGELWDICEIAGYIMQACHNKRLTISGGEPMEQWESLCELLAFLRDSIYAFIPGGASAGCQERCSRSSII